MHESQVFSNPITCYDKGVLRFMVWVQGLSLREELDILHERLLIILCVFCCDGSEDDFWRMI